MVIDSNTEDGKETWRMTNRQDFAVQTLNWTVHLLKEVQVCVLFLFYIIVSAKYIAK